MDELFELDQLVLLEATKLKFSKTDSGYLELTYEDKTYERVNLTRLLPFQSDHTYISVSYEDEEKNFREIGIIQNVNNLPEKEQHTVKEYLAFKYYMPEITKIHSIKDNNRGYIFVKAETSSGPKTIAVRDWYVNFKMLSDRMLYVVDVDGNKYYISDIQRLDKKSLYQIELFV